MVGVTPPVPRVRTRRRRWPWVLAVVVVVLLGLLVAADRIAAAVAASAVQKRIGDQAPFGPGNTPHVSINGFPFLTQAVAGRYDDIEVTGRELTIDQVNGVALDADMHGVHVPLGKAMSRHVNSLPIDHVNASVVISFDEVARLTGIKGLTLSDSNDQLRAALPVSVPGMGTVTASADAAIHVNGNRFSYTVGNVDVGGVAVPQVLLSQVASQMNGQVTLPTLPYRLEVTGVAVTSAGLRATARADHIVVDTS
jgi:hypothetical protein